MVNTMGYGVRGPLLGHFVRGGDLVALRARATAALAVAARLAN
jgi:hypothetical protein